MRHTISLNLTARGLLVAAATATVAFTTVLADVLPDNGSGTANLPPIGSTYQSVPTPANPSGDMAMTNGLPVGSSLQIDASLHTFTYSQATPPLVMSFPANATGRQPGGTLGGEQAASNAVLTMPLIGTGAYAGYNRTINLPVGHEIHLAPRTLNAPLQVFNTDMYRFFGQVTSDPDFDLLRIVAGTDFGLPSPGVSSLTQVGPAWDLYSYYDLTYRIDFVGSATGTFAGMSGSTTGVVRILVTPTPGAAVALGLGGFAMARRRRPSF